LFETFQQPNAVARIRAAGIAPLAAYLLAQLYFSLYPLLARVPPLLFWSVDAIAFLGALAGIVLLVRAVVRHRRELEFRAMLWLVATLVVIGLCARLFLSLTFPWL
jgi:hypothetical protein